MGLNLDRINSRFRSIGYSLLNVRWIIIVLFIALLGFSVIGLTKIKTDSSNDNWFLENDPVMAAQDEFEEIFGNSDYAAILVTVYDVFDPEILAKIRELSNEVERLTPLSDEVLSITNLEFSIGTEDGIEIIDLIPDEIPTDKSELDKLRQMALEKPAIGGKLVTKDSRQTWILLRLVTFPDDWENDKEYLDFIQRTAKETPEFFVGYNLSKPKAPEVVIGHVFSQIVNQEKYKVLNPKTSGMPMINYEKRAWFGKESGRLLMLAMLISILVLVINLRSFRGVVFPIFSAIISLIIVIGIQGYMGIKIDPSMVTLPMFLGFAVAVGYSIHFFSFYKRALFDGLSRKEACLFAYEETGWPILFTALTTIGALMSFLFIPVKTLRWIGLTSACVVLTVFVLTMVLLPALLSFGKKLKPKKLQRRSQTLFLDNFMSRLSNWIMRKKNLILVVFAITMLVFIYGLTLIEVSFDIKRSMGGKVGYVKRLLDVSESEIGALYSYDLGIIFPEEGDAKRPSNLEKFEKFETEIKELKLTKKTSSLLDITKDLNQVLNEGDKAFYKVPSIKDIEYYNDMDLSDDEVNEIEKQLVSQIHLLYENAGGSEAERWIDYDDQILHMKVEIVDYNSRELKNEINFIKERAKEIFPDSKLLIVGVVAKYTVMQDIISIGQVKSFLIALVIITILMVFVFGSVKLGLIGIIPNIAPAIVVGGVMGFMNIPLDMMTVTILPMLLGLAVDDTIHFMNHAHLEFIREQNYARSIRKTFVLIGSALVTTSIVLILNFSAYMTSPAKVYFNIGLLAAIGILTALVADFFVTPILMKEFKVFGKEKTE